MDNFLNKVTMYRLVLYGLIFLCLLGVIFGFLGLLPFSGFLLLFSVSFILEVSLLTNIIFSETFKIDANTESIYITALILALIISPPKSVADLFFIFWASVLAISSKYIFTIYKKHIFNPVAVGIFLTAILIGKSASWWIGNPIMLAPVLILGLLITRKIKRFDLVLSFLITSIIVTLGHGFFPLTHTPIIFFATIMLTEPFTTPPTKNLRIIYGILTGLLFIPNLHLGNFYLTPEISLLLGNIYVFFVSPKKRLILTLKEKVKIGEDLYDFIFDLKEKFSFIPGQYMEWNLGQKKFDSRGNRRYFTIASSPTENEIRIGVKFSENGSSFKKIMIEMVPGQTISATQLAGDFTLPKDSSKKLVFIAGGIGITPFRSMIKYLIDKDEKRNITLFYTDKNDSHLVYKEVFEEAKIKLGMKVVYNLSETNGRLNSESIVQNVSDYNNSYYYISGSHNMILEFKKVLRELGVSSNRIKIDYFPGL
jgi:ferredoxin-NADP reductase